MSFDTTRLCANGSIIIKVPSLCRPLKLPSTSHLEVVLGIVSSAAKLHVLFPTPRARNAQLAVDVAVLVVSTWLDGDFANLVCVHIDAFRVVVTSAKLDKDDGGVWRFRDWSG